MGRFGELFFSLKINDGTGLRRRPQSPDGPIIGQKFSGGGGIGNGDLEFFGNFALFIQDSEIYRLSGIGMPENTDSRSARPFEGLGTLFAFMP